MSKNKIGIYKPHQEVKFNQSYGILEVTPEKNKLKVNHYILK